MFKTSFLLVLLCFSPALGREFSPAKFQKALADFKGSFSSQNEPLSGPLLEEIRLAQDEEDIRDFLLDENWVFNFVWGNLEKITPSRGADLVFRHALSDPTNWDRSKDDSFGRMGGAKRMASTRFLKKRFDVIEDEEERQRVHALWNDESFRRNLSTQFSRILKASDDLERHEIEVETADFITLGKVPAPKQVGKTKLSGDPPLVAVTAAQEVRHGWTVVVGVVAVLVAILLGYVVVSKKP